MNNNPLLNTIAFDLVKEKVIQDKLTEAKVQEERENREEKESKNRKIDEFPDLDEPDSEEERIMKKEISKRQEMADKYVEKEKEKSKRKYGDLRDIIETEFLDTMLKNDPVVCHFYHNSFDRCKIIDKHLKKIAETHHDTLFVRINAEKTPFFTSKLNIQVGLCFNLGSSHNYPIQGWKGH